MFMICSMRPRRSFPRGAHSKQTSSDCPTDGLLARRQLTRVHPAASVGRAVPACLGGRAILLALWGACPFGQNALLRVRAIADPRAAPMSGPHGGEPVAVEAADPGGDG